MQAAAPYKRAGVMLLIINPDFNSEEAVMPGEILATKLAKASRGKLIKLIRRRDEKGVPPSKKELQSVMQGIQDMVIGEKKMT